MDDREIHELVELALRLTAWKPDHWYERLLIRQSDRMQMATLAIVIAIHKELRERPAGS